MILDVLKPTVRRAILDLVDDVGGEINDEVLALLLAELGQRVARSDVRSELQWLADAGLLKVEAVGSFLVASSTGDGRDLAAGKLRRDGVSPHKVGQ